MAAEEVSTAAVVAADFMGAAAGFTAEEDSPAAGILELAADMLIADIMAAATEATDITGAAATMEAMADMDGAIAATVMEEDTVTAGAVGVGAGDLATAGRIGDMAGAIRMATTATRGIMRHTRIRIRPTVTRRTL